MPPIQYLQALDSLRKLPGSALQPSALDDPSAALLGLQDQRKTELQHNLGKVGTDVNSGTGQVTGGYGVGGNQADLADVQHDIAVNPVTQQGATTADYMSKVHDANLQGFATPQEQAAYPRAQAAKELAGKLGLQQAQAAEAAGRGAQATGLAGEAKARGEAELIRANAAMKAAQNAIPAGVGGPSIKDLNKLEAQRAALEIPSATDNAQDIAARQPLGHTMGLYTIAERKAKLDGQIQGIKSQMHPGGAPPVPGVTPPVPSGPPPEVDRLQPGQVFETATGEVWGKHADGRPIKLR